MTLGASSPVVFETERLAFREMNQDDFLDLAEMLQNPKVMYAYEHDFSNSDVQEWLDRQIGRYRDYGFGLWAVISKTSGVMVGQAGLTMQPYRNKDVLEIGYLLKKEFWHCGYAREAAEGCKRYAFEQLKRDRVSSIIKSDNLASIRVAESIGIPFSAGDIRQELETEVMAPFQRDYLAGRTPLPCARCNPTVKFPALFRRAEEVGAQFVATGHYARIRQTEYGPALCRGAHTNDQAYMLARLPRQWLGRLLFPIGGYEKTQVRELARGYGIPVADKPDSMEICFIPQGDYAAWASTTTPSASGGGWASRRRTGSSFRPSGRRKTRWSCPMGPTSWPIPSGGRR